MRISINSIANSRQAATWQTIVLLTLALWLGASLLLDLVIMPGLYAAGMMSQPGFAIAGHMIFSIFNRIELVIAALIFTGFLSLSTLHGLTIGFSQKLGIALAGLLLAIPLVYTYIVTPEMSAQGLHLHLFETAEAIPGTLNLWHQVYGGLEVLKLGLCVALLTQLGTHLIRHEH